MGEPIPIRPDEVIVEPEKTTKQMIIERIVVPGVVMLSGWIAKHVTEYLVDKALTKNQ